MQHKSKNKAFTLIELLVVIAIIALLASIVLVALGSARVKARDAKRVGDIRELQAAFELYYSDNGQYPPVCGASSSGAYVGAWPTLLSSTYVASMPNDPTNTATLYGYYYCSGYKPNGVCGYTYNGSNADYILATRLENPTVIPNSCSTTFSGWDNGSLNYIVGQ
jgi:prepilin-type N-terminal cleavage/methylation domain-containing protein